MLNLIHAEPSSRSLRRISEQVSLLARVTWHILSKKVTNRKVTEMVGKHALREHSARYRLVLDAENNCLRLDNRLLWDDL